MKKVFLSLSLLCGFMTVYAQKVGSTIQIETQDNNRIKGKVLEKTETHLTIETASTGNITVERNKIRNIEEINTIDAGPFSYENQHYSLNFMAPTAFNLRKGEGFYKNTLLGLNSVHYGFTDHFSMGVGSDIIGLLIEARDPLLMTLNTKFSTPISPNAAIAGGLTWIRLGSTSTGTTPIHTGILYSAITLGNKNHNFTLGGGYPLFVVETGRPANDNEDYPFLLNLSGQYRLSNNFSLLTENWIRLTEDVSFGICSLGARYMRKGFAFDFAIMFAAGSENDVINIPIPFISVSIPFQTK